MRLSGTLADWRDDKGFGFITPDAGGAKVFVHVSAFAAGPRRPRSGDRVTYEVEASAAKGPRAVRVQVPGAASAPARSLRPATLAAALFVGALAWGVVADEAPAWMLWVVLLASAATFVVYALDKRAAREGRWRVAEDVLLALGLVGGWPGAALAHQWLRHKSSKRGFQAAFWVTVAINLALVAWVLSREVRRLTGFSF